MSFLLTNPNVFPRRVLSLSPFRLHTMHFLSPFNYRWLQSKRWRSPFSGTHTNRWAWAVDDDRVKHGWYCWLIVQKWRFVCVVSSATVFVFFLGIFSIVYVRWRSSSNRAPIFVVLPGLVLRWRTVRIGIFVFGWFESWMKDGVREMWKRWIRKNYRKRLRLPFRCSLCAPKCAKEATEKVNLSSVWVWPNWGLGESDCKKRSIKQPSGICECDYPGNTSPIGNTFDWRMPWNWFDYCDRSKEIQMAFLVWHQTH